MEKEYFYLRGKEQVGPVTVIDLQNLGLTADTLVWAEGNENWKRAAEVDELKEILERSAPHPVANGLTEIQPKELANVESSTLYLSDNDVRLWTGIKIFSAVILFVGAALMGSFLLSKSKTEKLRKEMLAKINGVLGGKTIVLDGTFSLTEGNLIDNVQSYNDDNNYNLYGAEPWWKTEKMYSFFESSYGGFIVKQLTKQSDDGYDIEVFTSGDLGYKKPAKRYVPPEYVTFNDGSRFKISGGYYSNNYRPSVRQCYREAFEYFTSDDKKFPGAYSPGKFVDITNFPDLRNDYFFFRNSRPVKSRSIGNFAANWSSPSSHGQNINTEDWAVYYTTEGKHYEISKNEAAINKDLFTYIAVLVGPILLLFVVILLSKPNFFRNLNLFGKRWRNNSNGSQVLYFEHSLFGKDKFVELIDDTATKGTVKFTDGGDTINFSYVSRELFYKIEKVDKDHLLLASAKDNAVISFTRVGATLVQ